MEECEASKHDQILLLFRNCWLHSYNISWFYHRHSSHFSVKDNYAPSTRGAMACFFSQTANLSLAGLPYWGSAITVTWATKFVAMLRTLNFNTKIHTCGQSSFFVGKDMLQSRFERTFLKMESLSVKANNMINNMNFKNAAISPLQCYYEKRGICCACSFNFSLMRETAGVHLRRFLAQESRKKGRRKIHQKNNNWSSICDISFFPL